MDTGGGKEEDQVAGGSEQPPQRMKIGWPTNVRHVAHVTFDRFQGFRGVPAELQPEPALAKAPSASKSAFGVSTESMQCAHDARGNSVPSILLHLQRRLYDQGGLATEGIFRVAADGAQEQRVRHHLDLTGTIPEDDDDDDDDEDGAGVDVHCLAGLIKAWFRELPGGLLDALPEQEVARCASEEEAGKLIAGLAPAKAALLDWAVQLMADVASEEPRNRMGARNVAMVFAPNMTQMGDPLTALKYAVHVMNFLNLLIERALRQRRQQDSKEQQLINRLTF